MNFILLFILMTLKKPMPSIKKWAVSALRIPRWVFTLSATRTVTGSKWFQRTSKQKSCIQPLGCSFLFYGNTWCQPVNALFDKKSIGQPAAIRVIGRSRGRIDNTFLVIHNRRRTAVQITSLYRAIFPQHIPAIHAAAAH